MLWVTLSVLILAAWFDSRKGIIPNWLTVPSLIVGATMGGWVSFTSAVLCVTCLIFSELRMGGGDLKLLAALGALNPALGTLMTLTIVQLAKGRISWRAGPSVCLWSSIYLLCLSVTDAPM